MTKIEKAAYMQSYYANNPEARAKKLEYLRKYHEAHKAEQNAKKKQGYLQNRLERRHSDNVTRNQNHEFVIRAYGGKCSICGSTSNLDIHHSKGGGKDTGNEGHGMVNDLIRRNYPQDEGIEILCHSCHSRLHKMAG